VFLLLLCFVGCLSATIDVDTKSCSGPVYSGHDMGWVILIAAGAGKILGFFSLLLVFAALSVTKTEYEVFGFRIYRLRYPSLVLAIILFILGIPMVVTGSYYATWSKKYDIRGGCAELQQIEVDDPIPIEALITPVNMTIAYFGDSGASEDTLAVYQLVLDEGAEAIVHLGDFDYCDDSTLFGKQIDAAFGEDFPFIPVIGNHDLHVWGDYQDVLGARWENKTSMLQCSGTLFVNYWCIYRGLFIAFSSVGTKCGNGYSDYGWHESELKRMLELSHNLTEPLEPWVTCAWHKNQKNLQVGSQGDETGYEMYNLCREEGALIVTGHSHTYARSYALGDMETQTVVDECETPYGDACLYDLYSDAAIVSVTALGGQNTDNLNEDLAKMPHWAQTYSDNGGVLFCKYNYNAIPDLAYCYFKSVDGTVHDEFYYRQRNATSFL